MNEINLIQRYLIKPLEWIWTKILLIYFAFLMILAIPFGFVWSFRYPKTPWRGWDNVFHIVNRLYLMATGVKMNIEGEEHRGGKGVACIYAANHGSMLDATFFQVIADRPGVAITAPAKYFPWPFSFWLNKINVIQVARTKEEEQNFPEALKHEKVFETAIQRVRDGETILIFPEGHLERTPHLQHFKYGAVKIALMSGAPLIPVSIRGDYRVISERTRVLHPRKVTLNFHKVVNQLPIDPNLANNKTLVEYWTEQLAHRIAHGLEKEFQKGLPECDCRDTFRPPEEIY